MTDQNAPDAQQLTAAWLDAMRRELTDSLEKIKHCLGQIDETQVWWRPQPTMNSIANVILHLCGNVRQWIISGTGGEPDVRDRPLEFSERGPIAKAELTRRLEEVVGRASEVLGSLSGSKLLESRRIQGFHETSVSAIANSVCHFCGHTHQIVHLTREQLGSEYRFQWTPATPGQGAPN